ncbi:hypothetical protein BSKO_04784 [Bryopsis sp. KO-2023]|nr:hypothetical protein BSKO_04784 [Bryopsis sp. KO-2023]
MDDPVGACVEPGKDSHRQAGRATWGKLSKQRQVMRTSSARKAVSSIPSKFNTILNKNIREFDGFGTRTARFSGQEKDIKEAPGPGTYHGEKSFVWDHESLSSKGYGAFLSKDKRLKSKPMATSPGPGQYSATHDHLATKNFNRASVTSAFHDKINPSPVQEPVDVTPGPGSYDSIKMRSGADVVWRKGGCRAPFVAIARRQDKPMTGSGPSPGTYNLTKSWEVAEKQSTLFKKSTGRGGFDCNEGKGTPTIVLGGSHGSQEVDLTPGPAAYDMNYAKSIERGMDLTCNRKSSMFITPEQAERRGMIFKRRNKKPIPGPGTYDTARLESPRKNISSPFMSKVEKIAARNNGVSRASPGPAFYTPPVQQKKSFHLNARHRFLPST